MEALVGNILSSMGASDSADTVDKYIPTQMGNIVQISDTEYACIDEVDPDAGYTFASTIQISKQDLIKIADSEHHTSNYRVVSGCSRITTRSYPRGPFEGHVVISTPLCTRKDREGKLYTEIIVQVSPKHDASKMYTGCIHVLKSI